MGYSIGQRDGRDIGYGVPAICDHPKCNVEIDRGMGYACDEYNDKKEKHRGCGLFFCSKHGGGSLCKRCETYKTPYKEKPDMLYWIAFKLFDESWEKWREDNPATVLLYETRLKESM